jgi:chitin synthase
MFFLHIQAIYNFCNLIFGWFALANLWLTFSIIIDLVPRSVGINLFVTADVVSGRDRPCW